MMHSPNRLCGRAMTLDGRDAGASTRRLKAQQATATKGIKDGNISEVVPDDREECFPRPDSTSVERPAAPCRKRTRPLSSPPVIRMRETHNREQGQCPDTLTSKSSHQRDGHLRVQLSEGQQSRWPLRTVDQAQPSPTGGRPRDWRVLVHLVAARRTPHRCKARGGAGRDSARQ